MNYEDYCGFNLNEVAFPVQDYGFKIRMPFWKKKSYQLTAGMVDAMIEGTKEKLPILDFTTMKDFTCVIADFDELPPFFNHWGEFHRHLYQVYPNACVTESASGKVKVIFLVKPALHMDHKATLRSLIKPELHPYLDYSKSAMTVTYINEEMCRDIQCWLKTAIVHEPVLKSFTEIKCEELAEEYHKVNQELIVVLAQYFPKSEFRGMNADRLEKLSIQLITSALELCNDGVKWNQEIFAKKLGIKTSQTAGKILQRLQGLDFLEMVSNYSVGNKSRIFKASGALARMFRRRGLHTTKTDVSNQYQINKIIAAILPPANGEANRYYLWISRKLISLGMCTTSVCKILYDIDRRRPIHSQRPEKTLNGYVNWAKRKEGTVSVI